ncbi:MAG: glycosyltransferase family 4 protein [Candidatus Latescibacterota bacterium]
MPPVGRRRDPRAGSPDAGTALLISSDFPPVGGGQSRFLFDLWSCLPPEQVVVLAPALPGCQAVDASLPCRVVRVRVPGGESWGARLRRSARILMAALRACRGEAVGSVHCGQVLSAGLAGLGCRLLHGTRYYPYVHGADLLEFRDRRPWGWLLRCVLLGAERVIANSRFTAAVALSCGVPEERLLVINPGIDLERFSRPVDRQAVRRGRGWADRRVVLSVGRLVPRKGQDTLIRALPQVQRAVPAVRYAIAGDGPEAAHLQVLACKLGVAEAVEFLGFVGEEELPSLHAAADVFAMVSRHRREQGDVEGFGIVYLEANAAGTPVLAGRSGGVEDAVADGESGLLVDPEDVGEVARALTRLLCDEDLRRRLGEQGRRRVHRHFDRREQACRLWEACR